MHFLFVYFHATILYILAVKENNSEKSPKSSAAETVVEIIEIVPNEVNPQHSTEHSECTSVEPIDIVPDASPKERRVFCLDAPYIWYSACDKAPTFSYYYNIHYCLYCGKKYKKISIHMKLKHNDEALVKNYLMQPTGSAAAQRILAPVITTGDHNHNLHVIEAKKGQLIISRAPYHRVNTSDFQICSKCHLWMFDYLERHRVKDCKFSTN